MGQLGVGESVFQLKFPQRVLNISNKFIKKFACGENYVISITNEGDIYGWGDCSSGKLGKIFNIRGKTQ